MDGDPWNWSVEDVRDFFQHHATLFLANAQQYRLPPIAELTKAIAEHDVSGPPLLQIVTRETLPDLGVTKLGHKAAILFCVEKLQKQSKTWCEMHGQTPTAAPISLAATQTPAATPTLAPATLSTPDTANESKRTGETLVEGEGGRKRRKLDLTISNNNLAMATGTTDLSRDSNTRSSMRMPMTNADRARFLPKEAINLDEVFFGRTKFGHVIEDFELKDMTVGSEHDQFSFFDLPKHPGAAQRMYARMVYMFNTAELGVVPNAPSIPYTIYFKLPYREPGTHVRARHRRDVIDLDKDKIKAQSALVIRPQQGEEALATRARAAVLLKAPVLALRPDPEYSLLDGQDDETAPVANEQAWLYRYYTEQDAKSVGSSDDDSDINLGISEDEEGSDMASEAEEEDETSSSRDDEAILAAVDKYIDDAKSFWTIEKRPKLEEKAWSMWKKTRGSKAGRQTLIDIEKTWIKKLEARISKTKQRLAETSWESDASLRKQCDGALQVTICDLETSKWKISVWQRTKEPTHTIVSRVHGAQAPQNVPSTAAPHQPDQLMADANDHIIFEPTEPTRIITERDEDGQAASIAAQEFVDGHNAADDEMSVDGGDTDMNDFVISDEERPMPEVHFSPLPMDTQPKQEVAASPERASSSGSSLPDLAKFAPQSAPNPKTPSKDRGNNSKDNPIELSSDASAPRTAKTKKSKGKGRLVTPLVVRHKSSSDPLDATPDQVWSWKYRELELAQDRVRFLIRLAADLSAETRDNFRKELKTMKGFRAQLAENIELVLACYDHKTPLDNGDQGLLRARLGMAWFISKQYVMDDELNTVLHKHDEIKDFNAEQQDLFSRMLHTVLQRRSLFVGLPRTTSPSESDSEEGLHIPESARKSNIRKRAVPISQSGAKKRAVAAQRQKGYENALGMSQSNDAAFRALVDGGLGKTRVAINPLSSTAVWLATELATQLKDYQLDGVRFMWRELTAGASEDEDVAGCVLAHTMGLGKTLQSIALLATISAAAESEDPAVREQLPEDLRLDEVRQRQRCLRVLVLCPPALLINWSAEITRWDSKNRLGHLCMIAKASQVREGNDLEYWYEHGGVILLGYALLRDFVRGSGEKSKPLPDEKLAMLLEGPDIVVADEAHNIKNTQSSTAQAAADFKTRSRIALTGTPMSNNVQEIYSLISWAAPGYLGDQTEFNAHYAEPINRGMYADSSTSDKRQAVKKLASLTETIQPKVHRRDITVLKGDLQPKVEFILKVDLTAEQTEIYNRTVHAIKNTMTDDTSRTRIFSWLAVLGLLTAHPLLFKHNMLNPPKKKPKKTKAQRTPLEDSAKEDSLSDDGGQSPHGSENEEAQIDQDDLNVYALGFSKQQVDEIVEGISDDLDHTRSAKTAILLDIIKSSRACGDKLLLFSSRLGTLDYIQRLLETNSFSCRRIDGTMPMKKRTDNLKDFQTKKVDVMLISTRAGGTGLNITAANRVVIFDFGFNPAHEVQAVGRAYRLGQQKPVFVYRFVAGGTFENNINNKAMFKQTLTARVVDKSRMKRSANKELGEYLEPAKDMKQQALKRWLDKDHNIMDLLLAQHEQASTSVSWIRDMDTMETLAQEDTTDTPLTAVEQAEVAAEVARWKSTRVTRGMAQATAAQASSTQAGLTQTGNRNMAAPPTMPASTAPPKVNHSLGDAEGAQTASARVGSAQAQGTSPVPSFMPT